MLLERPPHSSLVGKRDNSIPQWTAAYLDIETAWRDHDCGGHLLLLAGRVNVARPLLVYVAAVCIQRLAAWNHAALSDLVSSMGAIVDATAETAYDPGADLNAAIHIAAERVATAYPDYVRDCADIVRSMIPWQADDKAAALIAEVSVAGENKS